MGESEKRVAVIGGGPTGLFLSYHLAKNSKKPVHVTLYEASPRLGGKIVSEQFVTAPVMYEAGTAELYRNLPGPDPLWELVHELGLKTVAMSGKGIVIDNQFLRGNKDVRAHFGEKTARIIRKFYRFCSRARSPSQFCSWIGPKYNRHRLARCSFDSLLAGLGDKNAERFLSVLTHSDLATESHRTSGLYGVDNVLIDHPNYCQLYSIEGGIEQIPRTLAQRLTAEIKLQAPVVQISQTQAGSYRVVHQRSDRFADTEQTEFDALAVGLPVYWLPMISWGGQRLHEAVMRHHGAYHRPAHYLRIALLFRTPFWREKGHNQLNESFFQLDAFGGCCVYDEGSRHDAGSYGALSLLLAGSQALTMNNLPDSELVKKALAALPWNEIQARALLLEARVHRWTGTVNEQPGGSVLKGIKERHRIDRKAYPGLVMAGDYLADSTINGAMSSAEVAADLLLRHLGAS